MTRRLAFLTLLILTACGRPLSESETDFIQSIHGDALDISRVRLVEGAPLTEVTYRRKPKPRVACRERILPPVKEEIVTGRPAAVALYNRVLFTRDWYTENYLPEYPERLYLVQAMLLAHEMTHVWQWQNRDVTGYSPFRAAAEHTGGDDPYQFDFAGDEAFLSYGYEQQGAIVEEYVCCRTIAPKGKRTQRLHDMVAKAFPVSDLPQARAHDVYLPWKDADLRGICS
ncbi:MAG: hypothetical protein ACU0BB_03040 [Paracoccaceae bacterium]